MPYTVTRQIQWPEGCKVVEVSEGGLDYTNPDALVEHYPGEFCTYDDPREAVETAIAICEAWRKDGAPDAQVGVGATGGMTMPFDTSSYEEAEAWANQAYERLPKCDRCSAILSQKYYTIPEADEKFCSEWCADFTREEQELQATKDTGVCDSCLMVAYDNGIHEASQQGMVMLEMGADMEDHLCDAREEPQASTCECACNHKRR